MTSSIIMNFDYKQHFPTWKFEAIQSSYLRVSPNLILCCTDQLDQLMLCYSKRSSWRGENYHGLVLMLSSLSYDIHSLSEMALFIIIYKSIPLQTHKPKLGTGEMKYVSKSKLQWIHNIQKTGSILFIYFCYIQVNFPPLLVQWRQFGLSSSW